MTETRLDELTRISIHALREESDGVVGAHYQKVKDFYPRPPRGGRRRVLQYRASLEDISIHALREEGDEDRLDYYVPQFAFLSTPSARRATNYKMLKKMSNVISIHALREEGDLQMMSGLLSNLAFLSTPSARRATSCICSYSPAGHYFYPRPPRGGRQLIQSHDIHNL